MKYKIVGFGSEDAFAGDIDILRESVGSGNLYLSNIGAGMAGDFTLDRPVTIHDGISLVKEKTEFYFADVLLEEVVDNG